MFFLIVFFCLIFSNDGCDQRNLWSVIELQLFGESGWDLKNGYDFHFYIAYLQEEFHQIFGPEARTLTGDDLMAEFERVRGHWLPLPPDMPLQQILSSIPGFIITEDYHGVNIFMNCFWSPSTPSSSAIVPPQIFPVDEIVLSSPTHFCTDVSDQGCKFVRQVLAGMIPYDTERVLHPNCRHNMACCCQRNGISVSPQDLRLLPGMPFSQFSGYPEFLQLYTAAVAATGALEYLRLVVEQCPEVLSPERILHPMGRAVVRGVQQIASFYQAHWQEPGPSSAPSVSCGEALPHIPVLLNSHSMDGLALNLDDFLHCWTIPLQELLSRFSFLGLANPEPSSLLNFPQLVTAKRYMSAGGVGQLYWDGLHLPLRFGPQESPNPQDPRTRLLSILIILNILPFLCI